MEYLHRDIFCAYTLYMYINVDIDNTIFTFQLYYMQS